MDYTTELVVRIREICGSVEEPFQRLKGRSDKVELCHLILQQVWAIISEGATISCRSILPQYSVMAIALKSSLAVAPNDAATAENDSKAAMMSLTFSAGVEASSVFV